MLIDELKREVEKIPVKEDQEGTPGERAWNSYMNDLRELILHDDLREFLHWQPLVQTMFVESPPYIRTELQHLTGREDWQPRWAAAIQESPIGRPTPCVFYPASSGNLIHHAYHVCQFEEKTGISAERIAFVFEFGGGYGSMCRLFHKLGFQGRYVIYDLPVFSALQKYYLRSLGLPVYPLETLMSSTAGITCLAGLETLDRLWGNHTQQTASLFLATWSLSETPVSLRQRLSALVPPFDAYLISYQKHFHEVDNREFFGRWKNQHRNIQWHEWEIGHLPQNYYLIGVGTRPGQGITPPALLPFLSRMGAEVP
ncbi:MAG: hypothetical protein AB1491_02530 [Thermodesulfobacteriota bacterium]